MSDGWELVPATPIIEVANPRFVSVLIDVMPQIDRDAIVSYHQPPGRSPQFVMRKPGRLISFRDLPPMDAYNMARDRDFLAQVLREMHRAMKVYDDDIIIQAVPEEHSLAFPGSLPDA